MARSDKKKTGAHGKNRRDAHGVYQRRAERGKAAFRSYDGKAGDEFRGDSSSCSSRAKCSDGNANSYGSSQRGGNMSSYDSSQRSRN